MMKEFLTILIVLWLIPVTGFAQQGKYLGNLSANPFAPNSSSNAVGFGSPVNPDSLYNPVGRYGSSVSNQSPNNPLATDAPKLYDSQGNYRGKLGGNRFDPDSTSNPFGRYGSPFSQDSIHNKFGAGSPFRKDSPNNKFGNGLRVFGSE